MNVSPNTIVPNVVVLIPALICLLGIGIGIVIAFRKGDARLPLAIGGVAFFVLYFFTQRRSLQSPTPYSGPVNFHVEPVVPHPETFATWGLLLLILVVLIGIGGVVAAIRHKRIGTLVVVSALILAAFFIVGFSATSVQVQPTTVVSSESILPPLPPIENDFGPERPLAGTDRLATVPDGPTPTRIESIVGEGPALVVPELPVWRKNPPREGSIEQGHSKYVLSSQQFATVEEAEAELFQSVITDIQAGFAHHWPQTQGWVPTRDDITSSGLITEKVIETIPLKVGEFENPVYRVSWLIEFRPEVNEALHARWYPLESERRSLWLLSGLAGITALLGATSVVLRRQKQRTADAAA